MQARAKTIVKTACKRCGQCCDFANGVPFVMPEDIDRWQANNAWEIINEICLCYTEYKSQELTFRSRADGHCIFFSDTKGCIIYRSRPMACSVYPTVAPCHQGRPPQNGPAVTNKYYRARKKFNHTTTEDKKKYILALFKAAAAHGARPPKGITWGTPKQTAPAGTSTPPASG